jgi:Predicted hydrolases or acyltransferases (alpha/beta hydrolase superfamily)
MARRLKRDYRSTAGEFFKAMFSDDELTKADLVTMVNRTVGRLPDYPVATAALKALADSDLRSILPNISVPVLLVHGTDDRICPPGASEYMSSIIPEARLELIANRGHAPFLSSPERFNSLLTGFVESL